MSTPAQFTARRAPFKLPASPDRRFRLQQRMRTAVLLGAVAGVIPGAHAQPASTETEATLDPVVVTASRLAQPTTGAAAFVTLITAEALTRGGRQTVVEALRDEAGLHFRSFSGNAAQAELDIRGFGENALGRVLVLHDGRRLNRPDMAGIDWLQIPLGDIDRIEVLRGAQSVLYGDYALAGVVNIISRRAADQPEASLNAFAGSFGAYGARADAQGSADSTALSAGAEVSTTDGYRDHSGYTTWRLRGQLRHAAPLGDEHALRASYSDTEVELPGYLSLEDMQSDPRQSRTPDDTVHTRDLGLHYAYSSVRPDPLRIEFGAAYGYRETESDMTSWFSYVDGTLHTLALSPRLGYATRLWGIDQHWLAGIDLYAERLETDRFGEVERQQRTVAGRVDRITTGLYLLNDVTLTDVLGLRIGGRFDRAHYDARVDSGEGRVVDERVSHRAGAGEIGLRAQPNDALKVYSRFTTLHRFPLVDEQVSYYGFGADRLYEGLNPEAGFSVETGAGLWVHPDWLLEANLFQLSIRNEIAYNPVTGANENMDRTRRRGIETSLRWQRAGLGSAGLNYAYTQARYTDGDWDGAAVPLVPEHRLTLRAEALLPAGFSALATGSVVDRQYLGGDYANALPRLEAYTTLDLGLRYRPAALPNLDVFAGVDNVLDERYAELAYAGMLENGYYPAAGRAWKAAASYRF